jgi:HEAT repeat protein
MPFKTNDPKLTRAGMKLLSALWLFSTVTASRHELIVHEMNGLKLDDNASLEPTQTYVGVSAFNPPEEQGYALQTFDPSVAGSKQQLLALSQALHSPNLSEQYQAAAEFQEVLDEESDEFTQALIENRVIHRLVEILAGQSAQVAEDDKEGQLLLQNARLEAAKVLANITAGTLAAKMAVIKAEAVPVFIRLMRHPNGDIREQCIWALGNIASDGPKLRDYVLQEDIMSPLLENVVYALDQGAQPIKTIRNGAWAINNLCRGRDPPPSWDQISGSLRVLPRLLQVKDDEIIIDCAWTLAYMTSEKKSITDLIKSKVIPHLIPLLGHPNVSVQVPALRAVGNIATGTDRETQSIIDAGGLALLRNLLNHTKTLIVREACWAISNVTAGTPEQLQAVLDANIIPKLISLLAYADYKIREEACWALGNAMIHHETHPHQTRYLVSQGVARPLYDILKNSHDQSVKLVALDGLVKISAIVGREALLDPSGSNPYAYGEILEDD